MTKNKDNIVEYRSNSAVVGCYYLIQFLFPIVLIPMIFINYIPYPKISFFAALLCHSFFSIILVIFSFYYYSPFYIFKDGFITEGKFVSWESVKNVEVRVHYFELRGQKSYDFIFVLDDSTKITLKDGIYNRNKIIKDIVQNSSNEKINKILKSYFEKVDIDSLP